MSTTSIFRIGVCVGLLLAGCGGSEKKVSHNDRYLFYLHGGVVTVLGDNAINESVPEWGPYEYSNILDSLRKRNFIVISEMRKQGISDSVYTNKIVDQIDSLMERGVRPESILVIGASAGWNISLWVASNLKHKKIHYVLMGGCWPETYKSYASLELEGHFLSIIEETDPHGPCNQIFENKTAIGSYQEIKLNTGLSHGFIYKGYSSWIDPIVGWFEKGN